MENTDKPPPEKPSEPYPHHLERAILEFLRHAPLIQQGYEKEQEALRKRQKQKPPKPPRPNR